MGQLSYSICMPWIHDIKSDFPNNNTNSNSRPLVKAYYARHHAELLTYIMSLNSYNTLIRPTLLLALLYKWGKSETEKKEYCVQSYKVSYRTSLCASHLNALSSQYSSFHLFAIVRALNMESAKLHMYFDLLVLTGYSWTNNLTSLGLSFFICKSVKANTPLSLPWRM